MSFHTPRGLTIALDGRADGLASCAYQRLRQATNRFPRLAEYLCATAIARPWLASHARAPVQPCMSMSEDGWLMIRFDWGYCT